MSDDLLRTVTQDRLNKNLPVVCVGDTVDVHVRIVEGAKERIQVFTGVVIKRQGSGINETITVR